MLPAALQWTPKSLNASALILVHNHPSGDPTPSQADIDMTYAIRDAAEVLGLVIQNLSRLKR